MEDAHSEHIFLTPSCIDDFILGLLEDDKESEANTALGETEDVEYLHYECILLTHFCIDYVSLCLLEYDVKSEANAALGESADIQVVLGEIIEDDKVLASVW